MEKFLLYRNESGDVHVEVLLQEETRWLTQKSMADLFGAIKSTISEHLSNIYNNGELDKKATIRKSRTVQNKGGREVNRNLDFYNLDTSSKTNSKWSLFKVSAKHQNK